MKSKIIAKSIECLGKVCLSPKEEVIAASNLFGSKVQREVRKKYPTTREYWIEIKE
jgi:hypothetical protein